MGMEAWLSQWPLLQVLAKIQQSMDLLGDPIAGSPASTALPSLQRAMGFDDEAWRLVLTELHSAAHTAVVPQALRERVLCTSGRSCAAEFFARLQLLLYAKKDLPLRDQIFLDKQDHLLSLQMLQSRAAEGELKEYDWMKIVVEDLDRHAEGTQRSREDELRSMMPMDHPLQVDRMQLAHFILEVREEILSGGLMERCLEWDQPFLLASAFAGACQWMDVYSYSEPTPSNPNMGLPGRHRFPGGTLHYWGDMESEDRFGVDPESHDLILCPFIFEHVSQPWLAIRTLAKTLRPGGFIVWAAPMYQRYHGSPHDYYRYTPKGVTALAKHAGLEVQRLFSPGDLSLVNGVLMGMLLPYWRPEQILREEELQEKEDAPRYPLNVFALLRKPAWIAPTAAIALHRHELPHWPILWNYGSFLAQQHRGKTKAAGEDQKDPDVLQEKDCLFRNLLRTSQAFRPQLQEVAAKWPDFLTGILPRMSTVFQLTVVRHRASGRILVLANTHLFYHPNARHIRLLQIMCLLHEVQELRKQHKDAEGQLPHIIFAGDLNCLPETGAVQLLLTGQVPSDHEDWETSSQFAWRDEEASADAGEAEEIPKSSVPSMEADDTDVVEPLPREAWQKGSGIALQNPLGALVDVYANTPQKFTNYVHDFSGIL
ncbi:PDE12, partial [Symbiodinium necroappetens]